MGLGFWSRQFGTNFWPWAVNYASETVRAKELKTEIKITPFEDRVVAKMFSVGKDGWEPKGTDWRLLKASPWSTEVCILLEDGDIQRASTPMSVVKRLSAPKERGQGGPRQHPFWKTILAAEQCRVGQMETTSGRAPRRS